MYKPGYCAFNTYSVYKYYYTNLIIGSFMYEKVHHIKFSSLLKLCNLMNGNFVCN